MNMTTLKTILRKVLGQNIINYLKYRLPYWSSKSSYSQMGEDLIVDSFLGQKKTGFYVDIGAHDPLDMSNTYKFYRRGWTGIQIEPNYRKIKGFKKYRPGTVSLNIGIGKSSRAKFFIFESEALSTFSEEEAHHSQSFGNKVIETTEVDIVPLQEVFEKYVGTKTIDFMSIDTEGYDLQVLETNNWDLYRPSFIILETAEYDQNRFGKKENDLYDPVMQELGYEKVADTYINTIYRDTKSSIVGW